MFEFVSYNIEPLKNVIARKQMYFRNKKKIEKIKKK